MTVVMITKPPGNILRLGVIDYTISLYSKQSHECKGCFFPFLVVLFLKMEMESILKPIFSC